MGQDAGGFAGVFHGADDVQQEGVVALLGRRLAPGKTLVGIAGGRYADAPGLDRERRVGHHVVVGA